MRGMLKKYVYLSFVFLFSLVLVTPAAFAAKPDHAGGNKPGGGGGDSGGTTSLIGYDISYPQCGSKRLPSDHAFGIVGVNGGLATTGNDCLSTQMKWAAKASGAISAQDKVQLYVNTGNPGEVLEQYNVDTWPTNNVDPRGNTIVNPYGTCTTDSTQWNGYDNSLACSWQYGWNMSVNTVDDFFKPAARAAGMPENVSNHVWWLDVETMNSWQQEYEADGAQNPDGLAKNAATLEGMAAFYQQAGAKKVGIYSTHYQWGRITGTTVGNSDLGENLRGLDSWLAGAFDETTARSWCESKEGLTGGEVSLVQFVKKNLDHNVSCL